jgi:putative transposase
MNHGAHKFPGCPPRLDSYFERHPLFFLTFNTFKRRALLANEAVHDAFRLYCFRGIEMGRVEVGRYVLMPDHAHLFVRGDESFEPGMWIRGLRRAIGSAIPGSAPGEIWQPGFFDHVLRSDESYEEKWNYVRLNPMRAGLVSDPDLWPYQGELVPILRA